MTKLSDTVPRFSISPLTGHGEGEKILIYAESGMGKTTLATMAPNPVFIGIDDGARKIRNPITNEPVAGVEGVETFTDLRDAVNTSSLWGSYDTIVLDTITKAQAFIEDDIVENVPCKKGKAESFKDYGWDGPRLMLERVRLLLADFDHHVSEGRNVVLLAQKGQQKVANASGADYLQDGPRLLSQSNANVVAEVCEWCDHVLAIRYAEEGVVLEKKGERFVGKVDTTKNTSSRLIFGSGERHFLAKNRPPLTDSPVLSFEDQRDNSLWSVMFNADTN